MRSHVTQTDPVFSGEAYEYLLESDQLPSYPELGGGDPVAKVRLFLPGSRFEYFVTALTDYNGQMVMTGFCVSPLGPECDEEGDLAVAELIELRGPDGLPVERDCHWSPKSLTEIRKEISNA